MSARLRAIAARAVARAVARIAARAAVPADVAVVPVTGGVELRGRGLRRRMMTDARLRAAGWMAGRRA